MMNLNEKSEIRRENFIESYETLKTDLKDTFPDFNYQDYFLFKLKIYLFL